MHVEPPLTKPLDADVKAIEQINFPRNLDGAGNTTMFFIIEEVKGIILEFFQRTVNCKYNFSRNW